MRSPGVCQGSGSSGAAILGGFCAGRPAAGSARGEVRRGRRRTFFPRRGGGCSAGPGATAGAAESQGVGGDARHGAGGTGERGRPRRGPSPSARAAPDDPRLPGPEPAGPESPPSASARPARPSAPAPSPAGHCEVRPAGASWGPGETPGAAAAASSCRRHRRPLHRLPRPDLAGRAERDAAWGPAPVPHPVKG